MRPGDQSRVLQQLRAEAEALSRMHRDLHHGRMGDGLQHGGPPEAAGSASPAVESVASQKPLSRGGSVMRQPPGGHGALTWDAGFPSASLSPEDSGRAVGSERA